MMEFGGDRPEHYGDSREQRDYDAMTARDEAETASKPFDTLGAMMAWEDGTLSDSDTLNLFQRLVDSGQAWTLQGAYGRTASALLANGEIHS